METGNYKHKIETDETNMNFFNQIFGIEVIKISSCESGAVTSVLKFSNMMKTN